MNIHLIDKAHPIDLNFFLFVHFLFFLNGMHILVAFRSVDLFWLDRMTDQQTDNSWRRGSGPCGVTHFLCGVWESLLTSIYSDSSSGNSDSGMILIRERLSMPVRLKQNWHLSLLQQVRWDRLRRINESCASHTVMCLQITCGLVKLWNLILWVWGGA